MDYPIDAMPTKWPEILAHVEAGRTVRLYRGDEHVVTIYSHAELERRRQRAKDVEAKLPPEAFHFEWDPHEWDDIYAQWRKDHPRPEEGKTQHE